MFGIKINADTFDYRVVFDINSAGVDVGIVKNISTGNKNNLIWSKRIEYTYNEEDYEHYVRTMYATLLEIGMKVTGEGFKFAKENDPSFSPKNVDIVCILSHPWFISSVRECVQKSEKKFQISDVVMEKTQKKCLSDALGSQELVLWKEVMGAPVLLESYCDIVKLNGYSVGNFKNRLTNNLSMQFYFSFVSKKVQKHTEEIVERVFPNHKTNFITSTYVLSHVYGFLPDDKKKRHTLIEVGGEVTAISILKDGVIENVATVPFGTNGILKSISSKTASVKELRSSLLVLLKKTKNFESLPKSLKKALNEWYSDVVKTIHVASGGIIPPVDVAMSVDDVWFPLFEMVFRESSSEVFENIGVDKTDFELKQIREYIFGDNKDISNPKLSTMAYLLNDCTAKKGMCYNKK